jgi:deoxyribonuclease IV
MRIGAHVATSGGIHTAIDRGAELGCEAIQVFTTSPRAWKAQTHPEENLARFRARRAETGFPVVCHASYLINMAGTDADVVEKSAIALAAACRVAGQLDAEAVIVHVGSHLGDGLEAGLTRIQGELDKVLADLPEHLWLLLENTAGAGGTLGRSFAELYDLIDRAGDDERVGICLDCCHMLASGYDIRTDEKLAAVLDDCVNEVGLERLGCIHVNDSQTPLASNRDRHAELPNGELGARGLSAFLSEPRFEPLPALLEVPGPDKQGPDPEQIRIARKLRKQGLARRRRRAAAKKKRR